MTPGELPRPGLLLPADDRGLATGVGSMPGDDPLEAARVVAGELPELPHVVELPGRGPGADLVGRATALLTDLPVDLQPSGWRLTSRSGVDGRRAVSYLSHDLDATEEVLHTFTGSVKVQVGGPWTLAAALQLPRGEPVLTDDAAVRDVVQALADGIAGHLADLRRRLAHARLVLQLDEPSLPAVLAGRVMSFSGVRAAPVVPAQRVVDVLSDLVAVAKSTETATIAHCCAAQPPVELFRKAGVAGLSVDLTAVGTGRDDEIGAAVEAGLVLFAGLVRTDAPETREPAEVLRPVRDLWRRLGLSTEPAGPQVVVTPTCGLAGVSPEQAMRALRSSRAAAERLADDPLT